MKNKGGGCQHAKHYEQWSHITASRSSLTLNVSYTLFNLMKQSKLWNAHWALAYDEESS